MPMQENRTVSTLYGSLRAFGWVVLVLMVASIVYIGWVSVSQWSGIGV